ncbi:MAG: hypothetical protein GY940_37455 [bacterium]|nr:hypothetical protein [bacterium]
MVKIQYTTQSLRYEPDSRLPWKVGLVYKVDDKFLRMSKSKEKWVKKLVKSISNYGSYYGKTSTLSIENEIRKIYIIEDGKEDILYLDKNKIERKLRKEEEAREAEEKKRRMEQMAKERKEKLKEMLKKLNTLKAKYFYLDKILVTPGRKKYKSLEDKFSFEDHLIHVSWSLTQKEFQFVLKNKDEFDNLTIVWDKSTFVDQKGVVHKLIHKGVKLVDRNASLPPTVLPSETKIDDMIIPADYVNYSSTLSEWIRSDIFEIKPKEGEEPETIRVIFSLLKGDKKYDYSFYFKSAVVPFGEIPEKISKALLHLYSPDYYYRNLK